MATNLYLYKYNHETKCKKNGGHNKSQEMRGLWRIQSLTYHGKFTFHSKTREKNKQK